MQIFNTLSRKKEEFIPLEPGKVKMYVCGPTVYNYIHIGNARPVSVFDTMRRYLEFIGYKVTFVQNFTDIDDKIIARAQEEGVTALEYAERFIAEFKVDLKGLGIRPADVNPRVTESIDEIIDIVENLEDKGYAYANGGDVFFRSRKFVEYGKLSHQPLEDLQSGVRIDVSEQKEDPLDFVLWKAAKPGEPFWESKWGKGRPGWHIECSAMTRKHLGDTIDIHAGGQDLIFPHHENEIAQSECCTGKEYARYWMHNAYLNVDNKKMSKSVGNFFTVREIAERFGYEPIKFMMLSAHYRSPINYNITIIEQCKSALDRLYNCRDSLDFAIENAIDIAPNTQDAELLLQLEVRKKQFIKAMDDDLNTADAIAALFDLVRDINTFITEPRANATLEAAASMFDTLADVLGLLYNRKVDSLDAEMEQWIEKRQQARKEKNFALSDQIRDDLKARGITLLDTPQGVKWKKD